MKFWRIKRRFAPLEIIKNPDSLADLKAIALQVEASTQDRQKAVFPTPAGVYQVANQEPIAPVQEHQALAGLETLQHKVEQCCEAIKGFQARLFSRTQGARRPPQKGPMRCFHCNRPGHLIRQCCDKARGIPPTPPGSVTAPRAPWRNQSTTEIEVNHNPNYNDPVDALNFHEP